MKRFIAYYMVDGIEYGSTIHAQDYGEAQELAVKRNIGEVVMDRPAHHAPFRLQRLIKNELWQEAAHEAAFLGFVGVSSGALKISDVLGDNGIVHEILHFAEPAIYGSIDAPVPNRQFWKTKLLDKVRRFEQLVPGWTDSSKDFEG